MVKKKRLSTLLALKREFPQLTVEGRETKCTVCKCAVTAERSKVIRHFTPQKHLSRENNRSISEFCKNLTEKERLLRITKHLVENNLLR